MNAPTLRLRRLQAAVLGANVAVAGVLAFRENWDPLLFSLLLGFAVLTELNHLNTRRVYISASFLALVLAMVLLGPAQAVLIAASLMTFDALRRGEGLQRIASNGSIYTTFALLGAVAFKLLDGPAHLAEESSRAVGTILAVYFITNALNFALVALDIWVVHRQAPLSSFRTIYLPLLPVELAGALLTVAVAFVYAQWGVIAIALIAVIGLVFQHLVKTAVQARERGEQLEVRNQELAGLQVGLISTVLRTLSLRDHMTARHSAAVARYSRAVADALGLDESERETIHTAALFHDVGKFIFPDSILLADRRLTDEDYAIVRRHPEVGADLVAEIEGYEDVARIIRSHHERMDGRGYPDALPASEIPLGSRIIAVADVYDVLTARDTYRKPISMQEAFEELRHSAGTQLDPQIVEVFIDVVERNGIAFRHSTAADFEAELAFERRVSDYAAPRRAVAA